MINLFADLPADRQAEVIEVLAQSSCVRIERIVSHGQKSPDGFWYDQSEDEWVIVLQGEATLRLEGQSNLHRLRTGDYLLIPAHVRHRVESTLSNPTTIWLAVFYQAELKSEKSIVPEDNG